MRHRKANDAMRLSAVLNPLKLANSLNPLTVFPALLVPFLCFSAFPFNKIEAVSNFDHAIASDAVPAVI